MQLHPSAKRPICAQCLRPQRTCICRWIRPIDPAIEVLILQHPLEIHQAKGSARLVHLSLKGSRMFTGEMFNPKELEKLLYASWSEASVNPIDEVQPVLLYPENFASQIPNLSISDSSKSIRLVVLDGTWRKSYKMLTLNPLLQTLPRLSLLQIPPSLYTIRKAHRPHQLSTLEAACYALMKIEGDDHKYSPLLESFASFVAEQARYLEGFFCSDLHEPLLKKDLKLKRLRRNLRNGRKQKAFD